jgi:DNA-binding MarR family transcriptional regulator
MKPVNQPTQAESKKQRPGCPEEQAFLELVRTADLLSRRMSHVLRAEDLSSNQYNVLRILRGAPSGLPCGEIGNRMITRDPDITRLLDRLEKRGLISRSRDTQDRRTVTAKIAPDGLKLLARTDQPLMDAHRSQLGHLGQKRLRTLMDLLHETRAGVV